MASFLLDTGVCIDILRGRVPTSDLPPPSACLLSAIVVAELRTGLAKGAGSPARRRRLEDFMALFPVRDFDVAAAGHYGDIRAELERRGETIGPLDLLIAAHARSLGAVLVTGNTREFRRVPRLEVFAWRVRRG